jgi:hypothetical protein
MGSYITTHILKPYYKDIVYFMFSEINHEANILMPLYFCIKYIFEGAIKHFNYSA